MQVQTVRGDTAEHDATLAMTRIVLRPLGSGLPLGFFGFGVGILLATALQLGYIPASEQQHVAIVGLAFSAPLELLAAVFALLSRDAGAAIAMGMFACFWAATGIGWLMAPFGAPSVTTGLLDLMLATFLAGLAAITLLGKPMLFVFLVLEVFRMAATGLISLGIQGPYPLISDVTGILLVLASIYGGLAFLFEDVRQRELLPVFRRGQARKALEGSIEGQLERIEHEAGVRQQL